MKPIYKTTFLFQSRGILLFMFESFAQDMIIKFMRQNSICITYCCGENHYYVFIVVIVVNLFSYFCFIFFFIFRFYVQNDIHSSTMNIYKMHFSLSNYSIERIIPIISLHEHHSYDINILTFYLVLAKCS